MASELLGEGAPCVRMLNNIQSDYINLMELSTVTCCSCS